MAVIPPDHARYPSTDVLCVQCAEPMPDGSPAVQWTGEAPGTSSLYWHAGCIGAFVLHVGQDAATVQAGSDTGRFTIAEHEDHVVRVIPPVETESIEEIQDELRRHAGELASQFSGVDPRPGDEHDDAPWPLDEATASN